MSVTAKELAKELGISEAAVSMALNNKPGVSTATRNKVIELAKEKGYEFSKIKYSPYSPHQTGTIVFIIHRKSGAIVVTDSPFFVALTEGVNYACDKYGYNMQVQYLYDSSDIVGKLKEYSALGCKGVIVLGTELSEFELIKYAQCELPVVYLDCYFNNYSGNYVLMNNRAGAYSAARYLMQHFHTQPGYIKSSYKLQNFTERAEGFYQANRDYGYSSQKTVTHLLAPSIEGAYYDMKYIIQRGTPLARCYFCDNDWMAIGAMRAFTEAGYRIPEDIALIGFDDVPGAKRTEPPLSTVCVPKQAIGEICARRLFELIAQPEIAPVKIEAETKLIIRGTT